MNKWIERRTITGHLFGYWLNKGKDSGYSYVPDTGMADKGERKQNETCIVVSGKNDFKFMLRGDHREQLRKLSIKSDARNFLKTGKTKEHREVWTYTDGKLFDKNKKEVKKIEGEDIDKIKSILNQAKTKIVKRMEGGNVKN